MKCHRTALFLGLFGVLVSLPAVALPQEGPETQAAVTLQPLTADLLLAKGGSGANVVVFVGYREIYLIDAKMTAESAQAVLEEIKKKIPFPVTKIILTSSDPEFVDGLPGYPRGLPIISQETVKDAMIKAAAERPALQDYLPTVVFKDEMKLKSGRADIRLCFYPSAHKTGDTVIYFERDRTAYAGDLVSLGREALIDLSRNGNTFGLVKTLKEILNHGPHPDMFVTAHAGIVTRDDVEILRQSIEVQQAKIRTFIAEGKPLDEIKKILKVEEEPPALGAVRVPSLVEIIYRELTEKK
jgi:cyclase